MWSFRYTSCIKTVPFQIIFLDYHFDHISLYVNISTYSLSSADEIQASDLHVGLVHLEQKSQLLAIM